MSAVGDAVAAGVLPGRVWLYSNYHCNLACTYCLTDSAPGVARRALPAEEMIAAAAEAAGLGFTSLGVTGGEPFMVASMPEVLIALAQILPVVVLTNATLFTPARLARLAPLADLPAAVQVSLDRADPDANDKARGADNFATVVDAIARLVDLGVTVRVASTLDPAEPVDEDEAARLCHLHRRLGVSDADHVVRPVVRRGRAASNHVGVDAAVGDLPAELTVTADGAFWSPFGPTVRDGVLDTDLLITRTTRPLSTPAAALLRLVEGRPAGSDAQLGIR